MKKMIAAALCVLLVLALVGCGRRATFRATVTAVENGGLLVTPVEGSAELRSSDCFSIGLPKMPAAPEPQVGDTLEITYNGDICETYPATLGKIYTVRVVE